MIKKIFFAIILLVSSNIFSQEELLRTTALDSKELENKIYVGFDGIGNNYYIKNNVFIKQNDKKNWEYKNVALGEIYSVDIINPMKILVYYKDFNTIITLDNQLNEIQKLDLFTVDSALFTSKVGMASQNQYWIYDSLTQQIMLYNYLNGTFKNVGNSIPEEIKYTQSDLNNFYWIDEINNWYAVSIFGKVTLLANLPPFEKIQIIDQERILFYYNNILYCLNNQSKKVYKIEIVENSFQNFYFKDQILAIFTNQQIKNYKIKLP